MSPAASFSRWSKKCVFKFLGRAPGERKTWVQRWQVASTRDWGCIPYTSAMKTYQKAQLKQACSYYEDFKPIPTSVYLRVWNQALTICKLLPNIYIMTWNSAWRSSRVKGASEKRQISICLQLQRTATAVGPRNALFYRTLAIQILVLVLGKFF